MYISSYFIDMKHSIKFTPELCFVILAFFAVIVFANYGSCGGYIKPFNGSSSFSKYEGFEENELSEDDSIPTEFVRSVEKKAMNGIQAVMEDYDLIKDVPKTGLETEAFSTLTNTSVYIGDDGNLPKKKPLSWTTLIK
jgi:hypothetical protein